MSYNRFRRTLAAHARKHCLDLSLSEAEFIALLPCLIHDGQQLNPLDIDECASCIRRYFGLGVPRKTVPEIAREDGVSRPVVRRTLRDALAAIALSLEARALDSVFFSLIAPDDALPGTGSDE
ncbi:MAG: hypothetical protein A2514_07895 [Gammaproteobacteria bacterium RIFOXYD12_FULL_61_37]|nr:MAG: hypothetical protein A2514_07895 [Gammaproteobacteria bacterium RIFOXYD12_FULL_61_37]